MFFSKFGNNHPAPIRGRIFGADQLLQIIFCLRPILRNIASFQHFIIVVGQFDAVRAIDQRTVQKEKGHIER